MSVTEGQELGHYRLVAPLGAGGMGEVWLAEDATLKRKVALKVLPAAVAADPDRLARFQREAEAVAALSHPNIVTIYSTERDGDVRFLTMELIEGQSLDKVIPRGGLPLGRVLEIGATLADALAASHEKGIIHRDLKPANIMLAGRDQRVKVLDFGLAKLREEASADGETTAAALSGEGRILGTVAYMSPEQAEGKPIDARSDLFSLGIVLYELATGERPFRGDTSISVLSAILRDTPKSVTELRADLPKEFARIIRQCLQKDPEARYQTAKDLRNQLRALKADLESGEIAAIDSGVRAAAAPPPTSRWRRRRGALGAAAIALVVLGIAGAGMAWRLGLGRAAQATPPPFESVTVRSLTQTGNVRAAAISSDGRLVAYTVSEGNISSVWLRQVATGTDVMIAPGGAASPSELQFSADGSFLYFTERSQGRDTLCRMPAMGGSYQRLVEDANGFAVSPDGTQLAWTRVDYSTQGDGPRQGSVFVGNPDGTGSRLLAQVKLAGLSRLYLVWSPDGRSVGMVRETQTPFMKTDRVVLDAQTGTARSLPGSSHIYGKPVWLAEGWVISGPQAGSGQSGFQIVLLPFPDGPARRITRDLEGYESPSATSDGRSLVAVQTSERCSLVVSGQQGEKAQRKILQSRDRSAAARGLDWTADGRIVFGANDADGHPQMWIMDADGARRQQLTFGRGAVWPRMSPDGRSLAYVSLAGESSSMEIWTMAIAGGQSRQVTSLAGSSNESALLQLLFVVPDGRSIVYRSKSRDWKVPVDGGTPVPLFKDAPGSRSVPEGFDAKAMLPDGASVVGPYGRDAAGDPVGLAVVRLDGGAPWRRLEAIPPDASLDTVRLTRDGRAITYLRRAGGASNVWTQRLDGGPATQVTVFPSGAGLQFAWSHDGHQLAAWTMEYVSDVVLITDDAKAPSREKR